MTRDKIDTVGMIVAKSARFGSTSFHARVSTAAVKPSHLDEPHRRDHSKGPGAITLQRDAAGSLLAGG